MKKLFLLVTFLITIACFVQAQTIGTYPATTIATAGGNATVTPSAAPTGTTSIVAYTSAVFKGILQVNPATGKLTITNAQPAGTYTITVKAFNGTATTTTSFLLTVGNSICADFGAASANIAITGSTYTHAIGDFNNDGKQDIVVANDYDGTVYIRLGNGAGGFTGTTSLTVGRAPRSITVNDFNGDGHQDLAMAISSNATAVLWRGDGTGNFVLTSTISLPTNPTALAAGDFNGDGKADLAIACNPGGIVAIRLGDGAGNFTGTTNIATTYPYSLTSGDFNNDGKTDLVTVSLNANTLSVFTGDGTGNFTSTATLPTGAGPRDVMVVDFNGDGNADLAAVNGATNANTASVFLGNGTGDFAAMPAVPVGPGPQALAIADYNADGYPDFVTTNSATYSIRYGDGAGGFIAAANRSASAGGSPTIAIGDFNNDGRPDLTFVLYNSGYFVTVITGNNNDINIQGNSVNIPTGSNAPGSANHTTYDNNTAVTRTYTIQNTSTVGLSVNAIRTTGADSAMFIPGGITLPVLIAAGASATFTVSFIPTLSGVRNATVNVLSDNCTKANYSFAVQGTAVVPDIGAYPATATVALAGNTTLAPAASPANTVSLTATGSPNFKGQLQANLATGIITITNAQPAGMHTITVKGYNGSAFFTRSFTLQVGNTACSQAVFTGTGTTTGGTSIRHMVTADINNDGNPDLLAANYATNTILVRLGDTLGGFTAGTDVAVGAGPQVIAVADFNRDGFQDFATANYTTVSSSVSVRLGNGIGGFTAAPDAATGTGIQGMAAGDVNGDGYTDLVISNYTSNTVSIRLGDGAGGFTAGATLTGFTNPKWVTVTDLTGDGKLDLMVSSYTTNTVAVWLGNGAGAFTRTTDITATTTGTNIMVDGITISDLNNDGKPDYSFFYQNVSSSITSWYLTSGLGNGAGSFTGNGVSSITQLTLGSPGGLTAADFNNDGKADLLLVSKNATLAYLYTGTGNGNLATTSLADIGTASAVAAADFNKDGITDFAVANLSGTIALRFGSANSISLSGNNTLIPAGDTLPSFADATDFGTVDTTATRTYIIRNNSLVNLVLNGIGISGTDAASFAVSSLTFPLTVAPGGNASFTVRFLPSEAGVKKALVTVSSNNCTNGAYTFAVGGMAILPVISLSYPAATVGSGKNKILLPAGTLSMAATLSATAPAAFNGLLQVNPVTGAISITNAHPAGRYTIQVKAYAFTTSFVLTVTDPACSPGRFAVANNETFSGPGRTAVADFNGDGYQDLAISSYASATGYSVIVRLGDGAGGILANNTLLVPSPINTMLVQDFNRDGKPDLAIGYSGGGVDIRLGNGRGGFGTALITTVGTIGGYGLAAADFNKDGKMDFVASNYNNNTVYVRLGDGTGTFNNAPNVPVGEYPYGLVTGDFNGDGNADFAVANYNGSALSVRLGDGNGGFTAAPDVLGTPKPFWLVTADFNKDGNTDLAVTNPDYNVISIRLGTGTGSFTYGNDLTVSTGVARIVSGDFNGDGNPDVATTNNSGTSLAYMGLGDGIGGFAVGPLAGSTNYFWATVADLNNDGRQDLVFSNNLANTLAIRLNTDKEITVLGNNNTITAGSTGPDTTNHTSLGSVAMGATLTQTFTIQNTGSDTLQVTGINITGADAALFAVSGITFPAFLPAGVSRTFTISFSPTDGGIASATVSILSNDCDESVFNFAVQGRGLCTALSASNVWLGGSADWNVPANWSLGFVPNGCTQVVVNAGVPFMPEVNSPTATCYRLTLNNGATVTVKTGSQLNITGE